MLKLSKKQSEGIYPPGKFAWPNDRYTNLYIDIVEPLQEANCNSYLLTINNRFTRWLIKI